jgi:hypothetical protein
MPALALKSAAVLLNAKATNTIKMKASDRKTIKFHEEKSKFRTALGISEVFLFIYSTLRELCGTVKRKIDTKNP